MYQKDDNRDKSGWKYRRGEGRLYSVLIEEIETSPMVVKRTTGKPTVCNRVNKKCSSTIVCTRSNMNSGN